MVESTSRISKLILWNIILLFILVMLFTYTPVFVKIGSIEEVLENFLSPAIMILFVLVVTKLFVTVLEPVFKRALRRYLISTYEVKHTWQFISYLIWIAAFIVLSFLLVGDMLSIGILVIIILVLLIFIYHKSIINFAGWLHIILGGALSKGDLIEIDGIKGKVAEVSTTHIILDEKTNTLRDTDYTGRKISIPNSFIFSKPVFSISSKEPVIWDEVCVMLPSNVDHLLAEDIMSQVATNVVGHIMKKRRRDMIRKMSSPNEVPYVPNTELSLEKKGVLVSVRYFCHISERTEVRSAISEGVLKEFKKEGIRISFNN